MSDIENKDSAEIADQQIIDWRKDISLALVNCHDAQLVTHFIKTLEPIVFSNQKHTGK